MLRILRKFGRTDGAEIAEVAMVLPVVFTFLLGIVWFGRAFQIYSTITQAAQQGAVAAARQTCATCGNGFPNTVDSAVSSVMLASNLDPSLIAPNPPSPLPTFCQPPATAGACSSSLSKITICRSVVLNSLSTPAQCGAIVTFQYPFTFYLPFTSLNLKPITLTAHAQSRMEN